MRLSDTQLVLLSAAAQRDDGLLVPPSNSNEAGQERLRSRLLKLGVAVDQPCSVQQPCWREADDGRMALKITPAGLAAIGLGSEQASIGLGEGSGSSNPDDTIKGAPPRKGSKLCLVTKLLQRPEGATIAELTEATGWLAHSIRAVISGLRKKGLSVTLGRGADERHCYRMVVIEHTDGPSDLAEAVR
jgi:hypothetical protein